MTKENSNGAVFVAPLILFGIGCICIGYDLAKIVNDVDGAGPLAGVGALCAGLSATLFSRASSTKPD